METGQSSNIIPFAVYTIGVLVMVGIMLGLSYVLGQRHSERTTGTPFESGIIVTGSARLRFAIRFYAVAMFFVVFDLEAIFLFAWAVAARPLGWAGFFEALIFVAILLVALIYLWRIGGLDFTTRFRRTPANHSGSRAGNGNGSK